jgi:hypothetical protein
MSNNKKRKHSSITNSIDDNSIIDSSINIYNNTRSILIKLSKLDETPSTGINLSTNVTQGVNLANDLNDIDTQLDIIYRDINQLLTYIKINKDKIAERKEKLQPHKHKWIREYDPCRTIIYCSICSINQNKHN